MNICIFGSASNIIDESYIKETEENKDDKEQKGE